jgi:hypothetical protein
MMVLLKVARTRTGCYNKDDFTDMCGYASIAYELADCYAFDFDPGETG